MKRKRHKLQGNNYNCVLCSNKIEETSFHLFFSRPFSPASWQQPGINWDFTMDFVSKPRPNITTPFFMETFIIATWQIWKQRNNFIFDRCRPSFDSWKISFYEEVRLQANRFSSVKNSVFLSSTAALV
jgi:hypothetical protein